MKLAVWDLAALSKVGLRQKAQVDAGAVSWDTINLSMGEV